MLKLLNMGKYRTLMFTQIGKCN